MTEFLRFETVHAHYGPSHILHGMDFAVSAGETVGLLGRNGMGKTTTIRTLFGLTAASSGSIIFDGDDITTQAPQRRAQRGLALVPEGRGIFPNLSVRENLLVAHRPARDGRNDWPLDRVLESFPRLGERLSHGGDELSGGEQQMLAIGRALMTNPSLIVLDEATEGLAPLIREAIWSSLRGLRESGMAILVVDKDIDALSGLCDRFVVVEKGRVAWQGPAQDLSAHDAHRYLGV